MDQKSRDIPGGSVNSRFNTDEKMYTFFFSTTSMHAPKHLQLLKETGVRIGEASRLGWIDVDLGNGTIRVTPKGWQIEEEPPILFKRYSHQKPLPEPKKPGGNRITFKTLRHFKGTMEYHKTKDILHLKEVLGHRNISSTLIYTHLVNFEGDEYTVRVAKTLKEDEELLKAGFEYVTERDGIKIYRKRR